MDSNKRVDVIFVFALLCGALNGFMKAVKEFIGPISDDLGRCGNENIPFTTQNLPAQMARGLFNLIVFVIFQLTLINMLTIF